MWLLYKGKAIEGRYRGTLTNSFIKVIIYKDCLSLYALKFFSLVISIQLEINISS